MVQVSAAIKGAFEQLGAFSGNAPRLMLNSHPTTPVATTWVIRSLLLPIPGNPFPDVDALKHDLQDALGEQIQETRD